MRLLLIEADPALRRSLASALREEGYAVDAASDGEDGFHKARETSCDAVLLDVMLPKLDGLGGLSRRRALIRRSAGRVHPTVVAGPLSLPAAARPVLEARPAATR